MVWSIVIGGLILGHSLAGKVEAGERRYYLTEGVVAGNAPLVACHRGDHMASLWEVFNMTTLTYDSNRGRTLADSGGGPPAAEFGWIRTGNVVGNDSSSISGTIAGKANCQAWTTAASNINGMAVELLDVWRGPVEPPSVIFPWAATIFSCDTNLPVWCIEDDG
jgi:hypothetical protein